MTLSDDAKVVSFTLAGSFSFLILTLWVVFREPSITGLIFALCPPIPYLIALREFVSGAAVRSPADDEQGVAE